MRKCQNNFVVEFSVRETNVISNCFKQCLTILLLLLSPQQGRAVILYGANHFFCSGADLKTVKHKLSNHIGAHYISSIMHDNLTRFHSLPLVSIAMIEGSALGGGAELITACDFRVMTPEAKIGFVHARLGVTPGFGGGVRLMKLIGETRALEMLLSTRLVEAEEARQLGLAQYILPEGVKGKEALQSTINWYNSIYGHVSPSTTQSIKSIINTRYLTSRAEALQTEADIFCQVWGSDEHKRALANNIKHVQ